MNAPSEPIPFYEEGEKTGVTIPNIVVLFRSRVEKIQPRELQKRMAELLEQIQERMNSGDLGKAIGLIHNIPLEYSLIEEVTAEDMSNCNALYTELLREHDRLFESIFPLQFRKRKDQILNKNPS
ncbi:hypothetical protein KBC86_01795 [Candidatus Gracilibacteria bacterium]|nr:hypothetical protein [Candidatus Gracilibacteria bacterium]